MKQHPEDYRRLLELWAEIDDLQNVVAVLEWDEKTQMPESGAPARADQRATIERLAHERVSSPALGDLLQRLRSYEQELDYRSDEASIIRVARREHEQATKLPLKLVTQFSKARSEAYVQWIKARQAKDFSLFADSLERIYDLSRQAAEAIGYHGHPLNAILEQSEPGMTVDDFEQLFDELRGTLVPLVKAIGEAEPVEDRMLRQEFDPAKQWEIGLAGVRYINFKLNEGRADFSVHPFSISFSPKDTRITSRIIRDDFPPCFFGLLHEAGHGHYMQGIPERFRHTPLASGASGGMHESQSRTWENLVGRSWGFWQRFYPVAEAYFPKQTKGVSVEQWYRAVNRVQPSFIRVEADEVTYNLHIMVRWELEKEVFDGKLQVKDLAEAWNAKFQQYLGITPPNDLVGVLQDIHWAGGFGASFQSYTLGNVISVQLYEACLRDRPELAAQFAAGDYSGLLRWSREHVHAYGAKFGPQELTKIATGQALSAQPYLGYITKKYSEIYGLK
jgi:carboxypeptidase Taq